MAALSREAIDALPRRAWSRSSRFKPRVYRVEGPGGPFILKDAAGLSGPGAVWARVTLRREARALQRLAGLPFVPDIVARPDARSLAVTLIDAWPLDRAQFRSHGRPIADRLMAAVRAMHARGVYHLDLRHRSNVLVAADGTPHLVDFGAATVPGPLGRLLFGRLMARVDELAVLKYVARFMPEELTAEEARRLIRGAFWRRMWPVLPHRGRADAQRARERLDQLDGGGRRRE